MPEVMVLHCECGEPLTGRQKVQCRRCWMIAQSGTSQCPFCLDWYWTHSNSSESERQFHFKKKCKV
jgi:hypothetical protein